MSGSSSSSILAKMFLTAANSLLLDGLMTTLSSVERREFFRRGVPERWLIMLFNFWSGDRLGVLGKLRKVISVVRLGVEDSLLGFSAIPLDWS